VCLCSSQAASTIFGSLRLCGQSTTKISEIFGQFYFQKYFEKITALSIFVQGFALSKPHNAEHFHHLDKKHQTRREIK